LVSFHDENHYNSVRNPVALPSKDYLKRYLVAEKEEDREVPNVTTTSTVHDDKAGFDPPGSHMKRFESVTPESSLERGMEKVSLTDKPQRNDPCPCGSGKVFGKCHQAEYRRTTRLEKIKAKNSQNEDDTTKGTNDRKKYNDSTKPQNSPFREVKI
jgi:SEC-C motif